MLEGQHGVAGQLNVLVLDKDSEVTGFGKHARCRVGRAVDGERLLTVTADLDAPGSESLPEPDVEQASYLAYEFFERPTRLKLVGREYWESNNGRHLDYEFAVEPNA